VAWTEEIAPTDSRESAAAKERQAKSRRSRALPPRTTGGSGTRHRSPFLNRTLFAGVPIPPLKVEIGA
jgi:hypothetical protein